MVIHTRILKQYSQRCYHPTGLSPEILRASKSIYSEALPILYTENFLKLCANCFGTAGGSKSYLLKLGIMIPAAPHVRYLHLEALAKMVSIIKMVSAVNA